MPDATYIACPRCGEPYAMTPMQKRLYHGRTLACQRCAKPFTVTEQTPEPVPAPAVRPWMESPPAAGGISSSSSSSPPVPQPDAPPGAAPDAGINPEAAKPPPATAPPPPPLRTGSGMTPGKMALLIVVILAATAGALYIALAPTVRRAREQAARIGCAANLQQIGTALQMYSAQYAGRFPDSLDPLVLDGSLPVEALVCPSSTDTVVPGATPAEQLANLAKGSHLSYVYVGRGMTATAAKTPIAYEPLHHHGGQGVNVLYTDGTVQFLPASIALTALPQLAASGAVTQPPTISPTTQPDESQPDASGGDVGGSPSSATPGSL